MERDLDYSEDVYEAEDDETFSELVLSKFDGNEPIYLGTDDDGGLKFRQNLFSYWTSKSKTYLSEMAVVALGLTETCCRIRQGKVSANCDVESPCSYF